jgi:hypothetical protein
MGLIQVTDIDKFGNDITNPNSELFQSLPPYAHDVEFRRLCRLISEAIGKVDEWRGGKAVESYADEINKANAPSVLENAVRAAGYVLNEEKWWMKFWLFVQYGWLWRKLSRWKDRRNAKRTRREIRKLEEFSNGR